MLTASHKWVQVIKLMSPEAKPGIAQQTANDIKMMMVLADRSALPCQLIDAQQMAHVIKIMT